MQNETTEAPSWQQLSDNARNEARQILADRPSISLTRVAALADVSRMTLYRYLEQHTAPRKHQLLTPSATPAVRLSRCGRSSGLEKLSESLAEGVDAAARPGYTPLSRRLYS